MAHNFRNFPNGMVCTIWFPNQNFRVFRVNGKDPNCYQERMRYPLLLLSSPTGQILYQLHYLQFKLNTPWFVWNRLSFRGSPTPKPSQDKLPMIVRPDAWSASSLNSANQNDQSQFTAFSQLLTVQKRTGIYSSKPALYRFLSPTPNHQVGELHNNKCFRHVSINTVAGWTGRNCKKLTARCCTFNLPLKMNVPQL